MTAFTTSEEGGFPRPLTVDGVDVDIAIASLSIDPAPITDSVDTIDGGSVTFQPSMPGGPNLIDRYTISFPVDAVRGAARKALERIRARGGYHTVAYWKPISAFYTISDAALALLLPKYRQNAPQLFAGLIANGITMGTAVAPFLCWRNGTPQTVGYDMGAYPPSSGNVIVPGTVIASGQNAGYSPFYVGDLVAGDVVEIEFFPAFTMTLTAPRITFPATVTESHAFTFRER